MRPQTPATVVEDWAGLQDDELITVWDTREAHDLVPYIEQGRVAFAETGLVTVIDECRAIVETIHKSGHHRIVRRT